MALHPQRQRLDALQEEERVERRERRAGVAQQHRPHAADVRRRPERVGPDDAVVGGVGLREAGVAVGLGGPVEAAVVDDRAADRRAVAADVLRQRVDRDIGAEREHLAADRRRHRVVDDERQAGRVRGVGPGADVDHVQPRVADRLGEHEARLVVDVRRELLGPVGIDEPHLDPVLRQRVREQVVGAAVERRDRHDVVARARDVQHRVGDGRLAGCERQRGERRLGESRALELGEPLLEHRVRRVHDPRVDVAELLEREQVGRVLGAVEDVRRRLVDRHRARVRRGIGLLPAVQRDRLGPLAVRAHASPPSDLAVHARL